MTYSEKLKHPKWQKKRLEVLERAEFICEECQLEKHLHVHHCYYERGLEPWEYPSDSLKALCEECHEKRAEVELQVQKAICNLSQDQLGRVANMLDVIVDDCRQGGTVAHGLDYYLALCEQYREAWEKTHGL